MRRLITGASTLGAILVLGVCFAGGAQAHTFLWTGALPSLLLALSEGTQFFEAIPGGGAVTCKHARFHGVLTSESTAMQRVVGTYTGCEAFGNKATVTPAEYELSAEESVSVINKTISIEVPVAACKILIAPVAANQGLKAIKYLLDPNSNDTRLLLDVNVAKIASTIEGGGGACGAVGGHTEGIYTGRLLVWADAAGTLKWS